VRCLWKPYMLSWVRGAYLSHEGGVFLVLEVLRQDLGGEPFQVFYHETLSPLPPGHDTAQLLSLRHTRSTYSIAYVLRRKAGMFFFFYIFEWDYQYI
jgi:hypothetical protein